MSKITIIKDSKFHTSKMFYPDSYQNLEPHEFSQNLIDLYSYIVSEFGVFPILTSSFRTKQGNIDAGGVEDSKHLTGDALDFDFDPIGPGMNAEFKEWFDGHNIADKFNVKLISYDNKFFHVQNNSSLIDFLIVSARKKPLYVGLTLLAMYFLFISNND